MRSSCKYPHYVMALQRRFLRSYALRLEETEYKTLLDDGLIGPELFQNLHRDLSAERRQALRRPQLDRPLDRRTMVERFSPFMHLPEEQLARMAELLTPRFTRPGERLVTKGEQSEGMFFITSGAVEIANGTHRVRLGRGDFFGEMGLLGRHRSMADVTALSHGQLLELATADFRSLLKETPDVALRIEQVADQRHPMNRQVGTGHRKNTGPDVDRILG